MGKANKNNVDFKKVKLKVGKKLKKPNETLTSFNARKVILLGQLQNQSNYGANGLNQTLSHRQRNIKELCHRMRHHNVNARKDAVSSLRQLMTRLTTDQLKLDLKLILESSFALSTDLGRDIRNAFFALLKELFTKLKETDFAPHFSLIVAHVVCASTHLSSAIKLFSVKLLGDLLLPRLPNLVRGNVRLLSSYADLLDLKGKNLSRSTKSVIIASLSSILTINYGDVGVDVLPSYRTSVESKNGHNSDDGPINLTCCSLTKNILRPSYSNPFDFSLHSDSFGSFGGNLYDEYLPTFVNVAEKSAAFCHAFWLEITTSDDTSASTTSTTVETTKASGRFFDTETVADMLNIMKVYQVLLKFVENSASDLICVDRSDSEFRRRLDRIFSNYFENDKMLGHYAAVFPCHLKQGGSTISQTETSNACRQINTTLCKMVWRRLNKITVVNYLKKLKEKRCLPEDLAEKLEGISNT